MPGNFRVWRSLRLLRLLGKPSKVGGFDVDGDRISVPSPLDIRPIGGQRPRRRLGGAELEQPGVDDLGEVGVRGEPLQLYHQLASLVSIMLVIETIRSIHDVCWRIPCASERGGSRPCQPRLARIG